MKSRKNKNINRGAILFLSVFVLLFFVLVARFGYIEATKHVQGKGLTKLAEDNWTTNKSLQSHRGTIYDADGHALAKDVFAYTLIAILDEKNDDHVKNPKKTAEKLAPILDMKRKNV